MNRKPWADVFVLNRVDARTWRILNKRFAVDDGRHVVAHVRETPDSEVQVEWAQPTALPTTYPTLLEALGAAGRGARRTSAATRPLTIAHLPPRRTHRVSQLTV